MLLLSILNQQQQRCRKITEDLFSISVGHAVLSINGVDVNGKNTSEGKEILEYLKDPANYPVSIKFGRARLSSNEKLMLASMFHS